MLPLSSMDLFVDSTVGAQHPDAQAFIRLLLACIAGALVGLEREIRGREAGFRTNILVCVGSALVMLISFRMTSLSFQWNRMANIQVDPARIAYGVMTGIGFLGAGAIIHAGRDIRGLTTAAAMWCVAAIGLGFGAGLYTVAFLTTVLVLVVLWLLHGVEAVLPRSYERTIVVRARWSATLLEDVNRRFTSPDFRIKDIAVYHDPDQPYARITLHLMFRKQRVYRMLEQEILSDKEFPAISVGDGAHSFGEK